MFEKGYCQVIKVPLPQLVGPCPLRLVRKEGMKVNKTVVPPDNRTVNNNMKHHSTRSEQVTVTYPDCIASSVAPDVSL